MLKKSSNKKKVVAFIIISTFFTKKKNRPISDQLHLWRRKTFSYGFPFSDLYLLSKQWLQRLSVGDGGHVTHLAAATQETQNHLSTIIDN